MKKYYNSKTHEQFLIDFETKQPNLFNSLEIVGKYEGAHKHILVQNKYGLCKITPDKLLQGRTPSILSAIDKNSYFRNQLIEVNSTFFDNHKIVSNYVKSNKPILVENKYGICQIRPNNLLQKCLPNIDSAIDKTNYWINQAKEIHSDLYDYSLVDYVNNVTKVFIISPYQTFEIKPANHLLGRGCAILGHQSNYEYTTYVEKGLRSKHCINFKVYILKCYNDNETFYKIGKTYTTIKKRYRCELHMPYQLEILHTIEFDKTFNEGYKCCQLENKLQLDSNKFKYTPKIKFGGSKNECFSSLNGIQEYLNSL